ncbi:MAG: pyruvate:ferredoxin (flavodoxin) oxidoreductase, partial [Chitinophagaceae bacterium]|nr:pyruvate:ferredoxin (flavodoxin) oxidoreductase [Chitinophagaceae bacterium]
VYSNTGGQSSKSTPAGATAKFATAGKRVGKKNLAMQAISYGNVYVAQIAFGSNPQQTLLALREAEAYEGPSLILAYSHCIAHGYDMAEGLHQQKRAVQSAYWPLLRYNPALRTLGKNPFVLDFLRPFLPISEFTSREMRYKNLEKNNPEDAAHLMEVAQQMVDLRWGTYEDMTHWNPEDFAPLF